MVYFFVSSLSTYLFLKIDVLKSDDFIRLSPSVPNTKGFIWSDIPNPYEAWEVEVAFRVSGNSMHGGRGLAFWYAKENHQPGPVFGAKDQWDGLSVWLDSANPVVRATLHVKKRKKKLI